MLSTIGLASYPLCPLHIAQCTVHIAQCTLHRQCSTHCSGTLLLYCYKLLHISTVLNFLHCSTVLHCSEMQFYNVLHCTALHCITVLHCSAVLQFSAVTLFVQDCVAETVGAGQAGYYTCTIPH